MNESKSPPVDGCVVFQVLTTRFTVTAVGARAVAALRFLPTEAVHATPPRHERRINIVHRNDCYEISFDDRSPRQEYDTVIAMEWLHEHLTETALEGHGRGVALAAGSAVVAGRRVLFAGGNRVARTRLALRLLFDSHNVESDRYSLIDGDGGSGLPFRFALAAESLSMIPELRSVPPSVPSFVNEGDQRMHLFSPADFGFAAPVTWSPIDAVFNLDVNMGGDTRVATARRPEALEQLISDGITWRPTQGDWIGPLAATVGRAMTYRLFYGDVAAAGRLVAATAAAL